MAELTFAQELLVALGDKATFALHGTDKPELLQIGVGALGGNDAYAQAARERANAGSLAPGASAPARIWALTCEDICS